MVKVWDDRWLPAVHWPKPVFPKPENTEVMTVSNLRNPNDLGWNSALLNQLFIDEEIHLISKVSVSAFGTKDKMSWRGTTNGQYSVASGYEFSRRKMRQKLEETGSTNSEAINRLIWNKIWGLNIKPKIKHFFWRCVNNSLAIRKKMQKRGLCDDAICCQCSEEEETVEHVLFHC